MRPVTAATGTAPDEREEGMDMELWRDTAVAGRIGGAARPATMPAAVLEQPIDHPPADPGLAGFLAHREKPAPHMETT
ncbi:MAG: hypothetical protein ACRDJO_09360 [Actinomycetota bacterium]